MLCSNCGKREANVKYSENINGRKKELNLCEECSKKFNMTIDFSSFFEGFMENFGTPEFMPLLNEMKVLKCNNCGYTFEEIANTGTLGCANCYDVFEERLDPIIRKIQGANRHVGRIGKIIDQKIEQKVNQKQNKNEDPLKKLKEELKQMIQEEKYEEAAKIRDEIKKIEKEK